MAEILWWARQQEKAPGNYEYGDVIAVCPDGWKWGREELKRTDIFGIMKLPGVDPDSLGDLTAPALVEGKDGLLVLEKMRARKLAIDRLDPKIVESLRAVDEKGERAVQLKPEEVTAVLASRETKEQVVTLK